MHAEGDVTAWRSVCLNVVVELWTCKAHISLPGMPDTVTNQSASGVRLVGPGVIPAPCHFGSCRGLDL
jgi:hypothetical protein